MQAGLIKNDVPSIYSLSERINQDPTSATPDEIARLAKAAVGMPSNFAIRYNASRFLYHARELVMVGDARVAYSFIEGKFRNAQRALSALQAISLRNQAAIDQTKLESAAKRGEEIEVIEPFYLTKRLHRRLPRMPVSRFMNVLGQPY